MDHWRRVIEVVALLLSILPANARARQFNLTRMVADPDRPLLYAIQDFGAADSDSLFVIDTETETVTKSFIVGGPVTDMTVHRAEHRLYVAAWDHDSTWVFDLDSLTERPPLRISGRAYSITAGRAGRVYTEANYSWMHLRAIDTETGNAVGTAPVVWSGDGVTDPAGDYYYHCEKGISSASLRKFDVRTDSPTQVASTMNYGSPVIVISADGQRIFNKGTVYDAALNSFGRLGTWSEELYATTRHGDLAVSQVRVFNVINQTEIFTLPFYTEISAISYNDRKLFLYDPLTFSLHSVSVADFAAIDTPLESPNPTDGTVAIQPLESLEWNSDPRAVRYHVYFGDDRAAVESADTLSPAYYATVEGGTVEFDESLPAGRPFYWRVDAVDIFGIQKGSVWTFETAPFDIDPPALSLRSITHCPLASEHLTLTSGAGSVDWSVTTDDGWMSTDLSAGTTPGTLDVLFDVSALSAGLYETELRFSSEGLSFSVPVSVNIEPMNVTQLVTDPNRPYVYGLHQPAETSLESVILFCNADEALVDFVLPVGLGTTDMGISGADDRLYVTNWEHDSTRVIDLRSRAELPPLRLGPDVYRIAAGPPNRIFVEGEHIFSPMSIVDASAGTILASMETLGGDGAAGPHGQYYYHITSTELFAHLYRYDVAADTFGVEVGSSVRGSSWRNLVMSADGSRLFWYGGVYDSSLAYLGIVENMAVAATTAHGDLAFGSAKVANANARTVIGDLPVYTHAMAVTSDQRKLVLFDETASDLLAVPLSDLVDQPGAAIDPIPANGQPVVLPLDTLRWERDPLSLRYDVFFGQDSSAVANADSGAAPYVVTVRENRFVLPEQLEEGVTYFWRVQSKGLNGDVPGTTWSFTVAPVVVDPNSLALQALTGAPGPSASVTLTSHPDGVNWTLSEDTPWLSADQSSGVTPSVLMLQVDHTLLPPGTYLDTLHFTSGLYRFEIPISLEVMRMALTQMLADKERPFVYAIHPGNENAKDAFLLFINTETDSIERALPIGANPTDLTVNYGEARLYVTDYWQPFVHVIDLSDQVELAPLEVNPDTYRINAGRAGRLYCEERNYWITIRIVDTETGDVVGTIEDWSGDGEVDPTGTYYYHGQCCKIGGCYIYKIDVSTDAGITEVTTGTTANMGRSLVMSGDGQRLFWNNRMTDPDLNRLQVYGETIRATSRTGDIAISATRVYDSDSNSVIYTLPLYSEVMAVSGDQRKLYIWNHDEARVVVIPMSDIRPKNTVFVDILPGRCPNVITPLLSDDREIHPVGRVAPVSDVEVVLLGRDDWDVSGIDIATMLFGGVSASDFIYRDVASPPIAVESACECAIAESDGHEDLVLRYNRDDIIAALSGQRGGQNQVVTIAGLMTNGAAVSGTDCVMVRASSVSDSRASVEAGASRLDRQYPNPFNAATTIEYILGKTGRVRIDVFNVLGQRVTTLVDEVAPPGHYSTTWTGVDERGTPLASGIYLYRLTTPDYISAQKMILLK